MLRLNLVKRLSYHLVSIERQVICYPLKPLTSIVPLDLRKAGLNGVAIGLVGQVENRHDLELLIHFLDQVRFMARQVVQVEGERLTIVNSAEFIQVN